MQAISTQLYTSTANRVRKRSYAFPLHGYPCLARNTATQPKLLGPSDYQVEDDVAYWNRDLWGKPGTPGSRAGASRLRSTFN
jgi:hypothetical protein